MIKHDIHIHTHLSDCAARDAFMADYVKKAKEIGLTCIGFSDHSWDESIPSASQWYIKQPYKRLQNRVKNSKASIPTG